MGILDFLLNNLPAILEMFESCLDDKKMKCVTKSEAEDMIRKPSFQTVRELAIMYAESQGMSRWEAFRRRRELRQDVRAGCRNLADDHVALICSGAKSKGFVGKEPIAA